MNKNYHYVCGGINGGISSKFISLIKEINQRVKRDLEKGIVAVWHDESHFNRYIFDLDYRVKILSPEYAYPEGWNLEGMKCKMMLLDKSKIGGGHKVLRSKDTLLFLIYKRVKNILFGWIKNQKYM